MRADAAAVKGQVTEDPDAQRRAVLVVLHHAHTHQWPPQRTVDVLDTLGLLTVAREMTR